MSKPTESLLARLGPAVLPFKRVNRVNQENPKKVGTGECISFASHLIHINSAGLDNLQFTTRTNLIKSNRYLWIIDVNGLFVILESTPNPAAARGCVCHSNITAGEPALQGGELWFLGPDSVVLNFRSGRYGAETIDHEDAVIEYWESLGFTVELE